MRWPEYSMTLRRGGMFSSAKTPKRSIEEREMRSRKAAPRGRTVAEGRGSNFMGCEATVTHEDALLWRRGGAAGLAGRRGYANLEMFGTPRFDGAIWTRSAAAMCGIVGYIGPKKVVPLIIDGLKRLEYRGYDSAGIAVVAQNGKLEIRRASGKLRNLEEVLRLSPIDGIYGIGHTRWATHGRPTEENAHPHRDCTGDIVVVHNGIIENYVDLKQRLAAEGHKFVTETDTEVVAHLVEKYAKQNGLPLEEAVRRAVKELTGVFALVVLSSKDPNKIVAARWGPPAVIGLGQDEFFVASDIPALLQHTRDIFFMADGDIAVLTPQGVRVTDFEGRALQRPVQHVTWDPIMAEKGGFKHFMQKEIFEQPRATRDTMLGRMSLESGRVFLDEMDITEKEFKNFSAVKIVACGTSWHSALAAKF